jgi:polysaccharide deacetylase 2 family uncharacterized protein YibQ
MTRALLFLFSCFFFTAASADKPVLALVIDDLGYSFELAKQVLNLPGQHTFAIIPDTTYSKKIAEYAHQSGHELILHMPMQSLVRGKHIESSTLDDSMDETEITQNVGTMLHEVPYIRGINNHMGSKLTELAYVMRPVMESIRQFNRQFYFLDSRTTAQSQAYQQALFAGVPTLKRDVFLDYDHNNPDSILEQFERWLKKADRNGSAVAIAHPYSSTIELLQQKLPQIADRYRFMTISQLIQYKQEKITWPTYLSQLQKDLKN